jgi:predicted nucleic acid-binding protein
LRVVSDTTTLIAFLGLGRMSVLKDLFGKLAIPKAVYGELHQKTVPALEE